MIEFVRIDRVARMQQRREQRDVGLIAAGQQQCRFAPRECRQFRLSRFMNRQFPAQQARSRRPEFPAPPRPHEFAKFRIARKAEVIIRGEINPGTRPQRAPLGDRIQCAHAGGENFREVTQEDLTTQDTKDTKEERREWIIASLMIISFIRSITLNNRTPMIITNLLASPNRRQIFIFVVLVSFVSLVVKILPGQLTQQPFVLIRRGIRRGEKFVAQENGIRAGEEREGLRFGRQR